ncbi:MAG: histidine phosphatase family protein [Alphaproteobacteria bacterium]|nr:histidine phosphatase family protein [Alphaproteobacteria bacterium]
MPVLYIFRHAKSSWSDANLSDFERPLANRGIKAAPKMGALMQETGVAPDFILCSTSRRTRETLGLILPYLQGDCRILMEDAVYKMQETSELIDRLRRLPAGVNRVMVIGHNPIMHDISLTLCKQADHPEDLDALTEKFPTAGLATLNLGDVPWPALSPHSATLTAFQTPKEVST